MKKSRIVILACLTSLGVIYGCSGESSSGDDTETNPGDTATATDGDTDTDSDGDSDSDTDTDSDSDSDVDTDIDTDVDTDSDSAHGDTDTYTGGNATGEQCDNGVDDDGDRFMDCADAECRDALSCTPSNEVCGDGIDNDLDGQVDCSDADCNDQLNCQEVCDNGEDDDADGLVDCEDDSCAGVDAACGEVCGDLVDNDGDGDIDCSDADCAMSDLCGQGDGDAGDSGTVSFGGLLCNYGGSEPHPCACDDGEDNDDDSDIDNRDLHCFGPYDDDESSYATGIPGDNNGDKGNIECPFDGNSGMGNDDVCCNPADPTTNVTPNGCDDQACCEIDVNRNGTGEHVYVLDECVFAPSCGDDGTHGCACSGPEGCDEGQYCIADKNTGEGFCSKCESCEPNMDCANTCECGEICFGGFRRPPEECGAVDADTDTDTDGDTDTDTDGDTDTDIDADTDADTDTDSDVDTDTDSDADTDVDTEITCPSGLPSCPGGDGDCDNFESCINGCCYPQCETDVQPCNTTSDCPDLYTCITGCCISFPVI